jgi:hypothetical protein
MFNMKSIEVYCSTCFDWKGNRGSTEESKLKTAAYTQVASGWNGVAVQSSKTGNILLFNPVYDEDGYDGEFMIYSHNDQYFVQIWNY